MRLSAAQKLTAGIALAILVICVAGLGAQYMLVRRDLDQRQRALVAADMDGLSALYDQRRIPAVRQAIEFRKLSEPGDGPYLALMDRTGTVLAATHGGWPEGVAIPPEGARIGPLAFDRDGRPFLGIARTLAGGFPLLVARSAAGMQATLARMRRIIWAVVVGVALASLAVGHVASRWIMARITRINALADRVAAGDLSARLPGARAADEFGLLETHIHSMLDRIEALNRATNHLSDAIAPELRTPLTRIRTRLAGLDIDSEASAEVLEDIRGTIRLFESLLEIARAEATASDPRAMRPVDLSALLAELCDLYLALAEDKEVGFEARIDPGVTILGDRNLAAQLISNLLENAIKYTPAGERVLVLLSGGRDGGRHVLTVSDTGPGLPEGFDAIAFDRFTRGGRAGDAPGHGIGLALVRAIALRHGAKVSLPDVERGFCIEIAWPNISGPS